MRAFSKLVLGFLLTTVANVKIVNVVQGNSNDIPQKRQTTDVVNIAFCEANLPAGDKMGKKTLEEVHSYAELKHDPRASLPESFTVCSTIMITGCQSAEWPTFFNILDNNRGQFLVPEHSSRSIESKLGIYIPNGLGIYLPDDHVPLFPNQWIRSCMAINTTSGFIHWVVDGTLVLNRDLIEVKNSKS